jgi:4-diphosphocytidyl-2-C-methyl-D-erythritol kinase
VTAGVPAGGAIARLAPAKINLTLRITGRRAPGLPHAGYHELDSIVVFAAIGDLLTFRPAPDLRLDLDGPFAASLQNEPDNLVLRAARLLAETTGSPPAAAIALDKRLPVASGIGGGSADAAAALKGLAALWDLGHVDLAKLGARLGADVPVCLAGRPCRMTGIGEVLTPLPALPPATLVLANPGVPSPTAPAFAARKGPFSAELVPGPDYFADARGLAALVREGGNDLTEAAAGLVPAIREVLQSLSRLNPLAAAMSGSGATCFALFADPDAAEAGARRLRRDRPQWWVAAAPLLD